MIAKGWGGRGGVDWEFGISRCKLLYIDWINNRELYSISYNKTIMKKNMNKNIYV